MKQPHRRVDMTAEAYRYAEGRCIDALVQLRRQDGPAALECLHAAIKTIEHCATGEFRWDDSAGDKVGT